MLSRIAEALFWIGRYLERGDGTARILDVHLQLLLEDPWVQEDATCRALLAVMGSPQDVEGTLCRDDIVAMLAIDRTHTASIAHSVGAARENARRAREIISAELWEALNETNAQMPRRLATEKWHRFFRWVRERSAISMGVVESATSRDEAWHFFTLGRALERADMTARLLATRSLTDVGGPSWTTLLRSCGAYDAHLRSHRDVPSATSAVEFLLVDRQFPRSVFASVVRAQNSLRALDPTLAMGSADKATRVLGMVRSELEYRPITEIVADLGESMENVQVGIARASDAISQRYFPTLSTPVWIGGAQ